MTVSRLAIIKCLELLIAVACVYLHIESFTYVAKIDIIAAGAFVGFVIVLAGEFAGHLLSTPISRKIDILFCLVGCALFVAAGALLIEHYGNGSGKIRNYGLAAASLAIINGALFLIDSLLTWRGDY